MTDPICLFLCRRKKSSSFEILSQENNLINSNRMETESESEAASSENSRHGDTGMILLHPPVQVV
jgi:hypothetical protein